MMRSLYSGVSGLRTHQTRMDVIGNNIANVNTTAFKSKQMNFSDMLYQTTQAATGANRSNGTGGINPRQIGLGVKTAAVNTTITQEGANQSTGNPFDLKLSGEAFFIVSDGMSTYYTRDGSFDVDDAGNLVMASTGYIVQGWGVDQNGNIVQGNVGGIKVTSLDTFGADATTSAQINGILDAQDIDLENVPNGKTVDVGPIYDKAGYAYTARFGILPSTSELTSTKSTLNTENEWKPSDTIYKVDTSELKYTYTVNGDEKTLKSSDMPPELLEKLETAVRTAVNGGTAAAGITPVQNINGVAHTLGASGDWATVDLDTFIKSDTELDGKVLSNSELRSMKLTVNFSGGTGFVKEQPKTFPVTDAITIPDKAVDAFYDPAQTANTDGTLTYTYKPATGSITSVKQTYTDDDGSSVTKYEFKDGSGAVIQAENEAGTTVDAGSIYGEAIMKLLGLGKKSDQVNTFTTDTPQTLKQVVPKEFKLSLLAITDADGKEVNFDALKNNGTTSWDLMYNKDNGEFEYVGSEGNKSFTLSLSSIDTKFENVDIDMSGTSNVSNDKKSTLTGKRLDGRKVGTRTGVSIATDGVVTALYSNGQSRKLGQLCVGTFANAMGLENAGDNLYQVTASSGDVSIVDIKASGTGVMTTGVLEMSNVDLSQEFTSMITTQRGFQANSRIITTSDSMLEELVNLKR